MPELIAGTLEANYIDGKWERSKASITTSIKESSDGRDCLRRSCSRTRRTQAGAVEAAAKAFSAWRRTSARKTAFSTCSAFVNAAIETC